MKKIWMYGIVFLFVLTSCGINKNEYYNNKIDKKNIASQIQSDREEEQTKNQGLEVSKKTEGERSIKNDKTLKEAVQDKLETYLKDMTIEEKIGQLFMIAIRKDGEGHSITQINESIKQQIHTYHVGGVILFGENIETVQQTQKLISDLQNESTIPLFVGVDEEGGTVSRVGKNEAINKIPFKEAYTIGQTGDVRFAYEEAKRIGVLLKELGFNMDFAPVADIYNEPSNKVIGRRSFGRSSEEVIPMILAFSRGLIEENIQPVIKHFPGHGNTIEDSHEGIAYVHKSLEELEKEELLPFERAINMGVGAIMKGHLLVPAVDETTIVSLSDKWKEYMAAHYDLTETLVMTDAMDMGAVVENYSAEEAAYLSLMAGNDMILIPDDLEKAYEGILKAYTDGHLSEERIDESVKKILSKKVAQKMFVLP